MRKGVLLVVVLLAVSSLLAVAAYSSALVESPAEMTVVSTDEALLALWVENIDADVPSWIDQEDGRLHINFDKGRNGGEYGLQPGSEYIFNRLFFARNNSENNVKLDVRLIDRRTGQDFSSNKIKFTVWTDDNADVDDNIPPEASDVVFIRQNGDANATWPMCEYDNKPINVQIEVLPGANLDVLRHLEFHVVANKA